MTKQYKGNERDLAMYSTESGLNAILKSMHLNVNDEVIISGKIRKSILNLIESYGLRIKCIDFNVKTMDLMTSQIEQLIDIKKTKLIIIGHLFGIKLSPHSMNEIARYKNNNLLIIEECSQIHIDHDNDISNISDVQIFDFNVTSTNGVSNGAMFRFKDKSLMDQINNIIQSYPKMQSNFNHYINQNRYISKRFKSSFSKFSVEIQPSNGLKTHIQKQMAMKCDANIEDKVALKRQTKGYQAMQSVFTDEFLDKYQNEMQIPGHSIMSDQQHLFYQFPIIIKQQTLKQKILKQIGSKIKEFEASNCNLSINANVIYLPISTQKKEIYENGK